MSGLEVDGVPIVERCDEPELVSFKCLDPDGWRVEAYWEWRPPVRGDIVVEAPGRAGRRSG